jgi:voltage-gated potassium channel Kch
MNSLSPLPERLQMNQLRERLNNHAIVCGYGVKGRAIVEELLAHGTPSRTSL